jgi:hypothetical protein
MEDQVARMLGKTTVPAFYSTTFDVCGDALPDAAEGVRTALSREDTLSRIKPGMRIAVTVGSREINHIDIITKTIVDELKRVGAQPFLFPAMGSHGGATAEGQRDILTGYGITEETMGVPIVSSMDTVEVGKTPGGLPVHADKAASEADAIIPVGRIKPHPEFRSDFESGIMKMMAIGVGKQHGASMCHQLGMNRMPENILSFGRVLLEKCRFPFGIGIIENAMHGTYSITAVPSERIEIEEPKLLDTAKSLIPVIPFEKVDVIICEEMGKDISGTGMDSNVIGRSISLGISRPFAERIGVFSLTEKTHGNFNGAGLADSISRRLFDQMAFSMTYPNTITACEPFAVKIPPVMDTDLLCLFFCLQTCIHANSPEGIRVVWIKNTLSVHTFYISEALVKEAQANPMLHVSSQRMMPTFDSAGAFDGFVPLQ